MENKRVVCLNCIDGRVQLPVIHWIKDQYGVENVDMITEPGIDGLLADSNHSIEAIIQKVRMCIERNNASMIFVAGHHDCVGNPVDDAVHQEHIQSAVNRLKEEFSETNVVGLWVDDQWTVNSLK